jgi:hypothetical protein
MYNCIKMAEQQLHDLEVSMFCSFILMKWSHSVSSRPLSVPVEVECQTLEKADSMLASLPVHSQQYPLVYFAQRYQQLIQGCQKTPLQRIQLTDNPTCVML